MKFLGISVLIICLLSATFSQWMLIFSYRINQTYIAKTLCINRNDKHSCCKGSCYLYKQLSANEKPSSKTNLIKDKTDIQLFCNGLPGQINYSMINTKLEYFSAPVFYTDAFLKDFFHPPS